MSDDNAEKPPTDNLAVRMAPVVRARIRQITGRQYVKLEAELLNLSGDALMDLTRLLGDMEQNVTRAKNQAIHQPWRRG